MDDMKDIFDTPFAAFVEGAVKDLFAFNPEKISIVATARDGTTTTSYYNANVADKALFAHHIYTDAIMSIVVANAHLIKDALEKDDEQPESWEEDNEQT